MNPALVVPIAEMPPYLGNSLFHGLAVGLGGALAYLLTFFLLWLIGKFALKSRIPVAQSRMICLLVAIAVALTIWIVLFDQTAESSSDSPLPPAMTNSTTTR